MIDTKRAGFRFVVRPGVRTFVGVVHGQTGTIISEYDNGLGEQIALVHVDGIGEATLKLQDIELLGEQKAA